MSDKQSVVLQTCLHVLGSKLGGFFSELSCLQLSSALSVLTMAPRTNEVLAAHSKVWEEMIHPFKLLVECEKAFYEWTFMTPIPAYDLSATPNAGGAPTEKRAKGSGNEDHVKYMYSQIPMALRKTMTHLQKMMGPAFAGTSSKLPTSASSVHHLAAYATSAAVGGADAAHFASLYHLLDELISGYVMLKITMIQLYQNLNAPYVTAARVKDMNWSELARVCANLSAKCDKAFTHASLMRVKDALLRPELFLLEQLCMLEGEQAMMPACDAKHTMFLLMRVRLEHTRWMQRLLARDRERSTSPTSGTGQSLGSASRKLGGMPGGIGSPAGPLVVQTVSCTFPAVLHWTHLLHHSLLCKATLLFWNTLHSAEIRGDEMQQKLERLDANYVGMIDKLVKRLPNCYSFSVLLDCSGLPRVVDPAHPLVLHDVLAPPPTDDAPPGGLARYPVVFTWPLSRPPLEKWNLVSTLIAKQDLMAGLAGTPGPLTIPRQTATYTLAVGPSNQTSDLMIWDYENEVISAQSTGVIAPNSVSYFLARADMHTSVYLVLTFQANTAAATDAPTPTANHTRDTSLTGEDRAMTPSGSSASLAPTPTHLSVAASVASPHATSSSLPSAAGRKRAFDLILGEVTPILHRMRHMHVFQQMQPGLGKKKG